MPTTAATTAPTATSMSLRAVGEEVTFLSLYAADVLSVPQPGDADKARLRALVTQVRSDLQTATDRLLSHLGGSPGDNEEHGN